MAIIDPRGGARTDNFGELLVNGLPVEVGLLQEGDGLLQLWVLGRHGDCRSHLSACDHGNGALHSVDELSSECLPNPAVIGDDWNFRMAFMQLKHEITLN